MSTIRTVIDPDARIRSGPPSFKWDQQSRIPIHTRVEVLEVRGKFARVFGLGGTDFRWTARSNLASFYKDAGYLAAAVLAPEPGVQIAPNWSSLRKKLAGTYNRLGGLMRRLATETRIEVPAVLAVWQVESAGRRHTPQRAIVRFENHKLFERWGRANEALYDRHFQHGGHAGVAGKAWERHKFRRVASQPFHPFHGKQEREYKVLNFATELAGRASAVQCISIGGSQILVSNFRLIGYRGSLAMYNAFQADERAHVLGFFDFCRRRGLIPNLRAKDWVGFARGYNGAGQAPRYGKLIRQAYNAGKGVLR